MEIKLNLGCGFVKKEGFVNIDNNNKCKPNMVRDLTRGLPFNNDVVDFIISEHTFEHFNGEDLIFVFNECHRVLKPHGILEFAVPYGRNSYIDPTHLQHFQPFSFNFFFIPDRNSVGAGVGGWFLPLELTFNDAEIRWVFEKIPQEELQKHHDKYFNEENNIYEFGYKVNDLRGEDENS